MEGKTFRRWRGSEGGVDTGPVLLREENETKFDSDHGVLTGRRLQKSTSYHIILPTTTLKRLRDNFVYGETSSDEPPNSCDGERCGTGQSRNPSASSEIEIGTVKKEHKSSSSHVSTPESYDTDSSGKDSGYLTLEDLEEQFRMKLPWKDQNVNTRERRIQVNFDDIIKSKERDGKRNTGDSQDHEFTSDDDVFEGDESEDDDDVFLGTTDDDAHFQRRAPSFDDVKTSTKDTSTKDGNEVQWGATGNSPPRKSTYYSVMIRQVQERSSDIKHLLNFYNHNETSTLKTQERKMYEAGERPLDENCNGSLDEQIYMSWEEVMMEAKHLGIKLILPRTKKRERVWFSLDDTKRDGRNDGSSFGKISADQKNGSDDVLEIKSSFAISKSKKHSKNGLDSFERTRKHQTCCSYCRERISKCLNCHPKHVLSPISGVPQLRPINHRNSSMNFLSKMSDANRSTCVYEQVVKCAVMKYDFVTCLKQLQDRDWYWGSRSVEKIEEHLTGREEGCFVLRDSSDDRHILTVSYVNYGRIRHTRLEHHRDRFCVKDNQSSRLMSVPEFFSKIDAIFSDSFKILERVCFLIKFKDQILESKISTSAGQSTSVRLSKPLSKNCCPLV